MFGYHVGMQILAQAIAVLQSHGPGNILIQVTVGTLTIQRLIWNSDSQGYESPPTNKH